MIAGHDEEYMSNGSEEVVSGRACDCDAEGSVDRYCVIVRILIEKSRSFATLCSY